LLPGSLLRAVLQEIRKSSIDISVGVLGKRFHSTDDLEIPVKKINQRFDNDLIAAAQIHRLAKSTGAAIVHSWGRAANRLAKIASLWSAWHFVSTKLDLIDDETLVFPKFAQRNLPQQVVVVSHRSIEVLARAQGLAPNQVQRIRIGAPATGKNDQATPLENRLAVLPPDHFLIITRARLLPESRLKDLLWATDLLQCVRPDFRFLIFGEGPQQWRLQRYARQTTADAKAVFMNPSDDFFRWLSIADLYWHPTHFRPRPFEPIAALRCGVPVLAAKSDAMAEMIQDGVNGILFDQGQRDQIARFTNMLFDDTEKLQQMKKNAAASGAAYSIADTADDLLAIYEKLLG
jgi:glycosyltransferase involved in cell wall biosynthesis